MNKPSIELKKVKTFRGMEGYGLNAEVYVNGIKACFVIDEGNGGEMRFDQVYDRASMELLEKYAKSIPQTPLEVNGKPYMRDGKVVMMDTTVAELIDDAFDEIQKKKEEAKLVKKFANHLVWGVPGAAQYAQVKYNVPLAAIPAAQLQAAVDKWKATFKKDERFFNTNLKTLGIKF